MLNNILDYIVLPKSTRELGELNKIHEKFNDKLLSPEQTRHIIYSKKWKYHKDKIDFLVLATVLYEKTTNDRKGS